MAKYIPIGEPTNQAEAEAIRKLRDSLPDHFVVIGNFELQLPNRPNTFEYDAVVIGEYGLYAVEIKGWGGEIRGDIRRWQLDWGKVQNPFILTERKAKALRSFIWHVVPDLPREVFCKSVVMLPSKTRVMVDDPRSSRIVTPETLYDFFVDVDRIRAHGPGALLNQPLRLAIEKALLPLASPATSIPRIPDYEIIGEPEGREEQPYREFVGRHRLLRARSRVRIKLYSLDPLATGPEQEDEFERILRDMEVLTRLDTNPYIASAYEVFRDHEDELNFYLVSEWVGPNTLGEFVRRHDYGGGHSEALALGCHFLRAVRFIHQRGVVHRNLSPEVIYLTESGSEVPLKITDFDYARVVQLPSIEGNFDKMGTEGYAAPELWRANDYDQRVDVFSCGAILFELIAGRRLYENLGEMLRPAETWAKRRDLIEPERWRLTLDKLLAADPSQRSSDLDEAIEVFETC